MPKSFAPIELAPGAVATQTCVVTNVVGKLVVLQALPQTLPPLL